MTQARFTLKGSRRASEQLRRMAQNFPRQIESALYGEAEEIMTVAKRDHVPKDVGTLVNTGHVEAPKRKGENVTVTMVFGGSAAPYALAIHEHPSKHSPPSWKGIRDSRGRFRKVRFSPAGTGPKYLEIPMNAAISGLDDRIARKLKPRA